jgi:acetyl-CoA synthetase
VLTFKQLHREVCRFANVLKRQGLAKGDRAIIYLPMVPEAAIAMLACARIGAVHSVVFGGFSAQSVADRIHDSQAKLVITSDGGFRRGASCRLKERTSRSLKDEAGNLLALISKVVVLRAPQEIAMQEGRDVWWHKEIEIAMRIVRRRKWTVKRPYSSSTPAVRPGSRRASFIPPPVICWWPTSRCVFDLRDEDVCWCTADVPAG